MKGRTLAWIALIVLAAALAAQTVRWRSAMAASRQLRGVEQLAVAASSRGRAPLALLAGGLQALRGAQELDPVEVKIPMARGELQLLFRNYEAAAEAYREAEAIEPRPEIYLGLGHAYARQGRTEEAVHNYGLALRLDPRLAPSIPEEFRAP